MPTLVPARRGRRRLPKNTFALSDELKAGLTSLRKLDGLTEAEQVERAVMLWILAHPPRTTSGHLEPDLKEHLLWRLTRVPDAAWAAARRRKGDPQADLCGRPKKSARAKRGAHVHN